MNMSRFALTVLLLAPAFGCSPDYPVRTASETPIQAWGPTNANPLGAGFDGAKGWIRRSRSAGIQTNNTGEDQPAGAADGSEPFNLETNGTPGAAGSRR
jgi:hypothetical protein